MIPEPAGPLDLLEGQRAFVAYGRPWKDAVIALIAPASKYTPWFYNREIHHGDVLITVLDTSPQVFGCIEIVGRDPTSDSAAIELTWNLTSLPTVPQWLDLPPEPGALSRDIAAMLLRRLGRERWGTNTHLFGISPPTTAEAARVLMESGGRCTHCDEEIDLSKPDAREQIHVYLADANSHVEQHYSDWPAALCTRCSKKMSAGGFINYLDFRFAANPQCPRCSGHRSVEHLVMPMMEDGLPPESPWQFSEGTHDFDGDGFWLCHYCHLLFGDAPEGRRRYF
ncbi:hypothetical protein CH299_19480 [Rhodococcus sp. 14-2686-1-2]|nr:hypothetical protein CH301_18950 [Rhodococcus sp. 15-1189-1-1a]OZF11600.1 hypothetical protein CH299_19480 [Rhodococcus sp. 14-2686-1-2]